MLVASQKMSLQGKSRHFPLHNGSEQSILVITLHMVNRHCSLPLEPLQDSEVPVQEGFVQMSNSNELTGGLICYQPVCKSAQ